MSNQEKLEYYANTTNSEARPALILATSLVKHEHGKIAIDCGCGAGSNIEYLRKEGFVVHAFDIEKEALKICKERFKDDPLVYLSHNSFSTFNYPKASLVVADASLFFCPKREFNAVWNNIYASLPSGGIFYGSFLGPNDSMANPDFNKEAFWPDVLILDEDSLRSYFSKYAIHQFKEHDAAGETATGKPHKWHIYSVVAEKM